MKAPARDWLAWFLAGVLVITGASALNLTRYIGLPYGGFLEEHRLWAYDRLQVGANTPSWWPNYACCNLLLTGLTTIDGQPYRPGQDRKYQAAAASGRTTVTLGLERDGVPESLVLPIQYFSWSDWLDLRLSNTILAVCLWLLAVLVYATEPSAALNRVTAWTLGWVAAIWGWALFSPFVDVDLPTLVLTAVYVTVWPFLNAALIHFALEFPIPSRALKRPVLIVVYGAASALAAVYVFSRVHYWVVGVTPLNAWLDLFCWSWSVKYMAPFALSVLAGRLLWLGWRGRGHPTLRRQMQVVLVGIAITTPFLVGYFREAYGVVASGYFVNALDLRYLLLGVPLAFAFISLRYRTFQAIHPLYLAVFTLASSALAASFGVWLSQGWTGQQLTQPNLRVFLPVFVPMILSGLFWNAQFVWRGWFSRWFQQETRSLVTARQFGRRLMQQAVSMERLPDLIAEEWRRQLQADRAALWLTRSQEPLQQSFGQAGPWAAGLPAHFNPPDAVLAARLPAGDPLAQAGGRLLIPLVAAGQTAGYLVLGAPSDTELWDQADLDVMELLAQQSALFWLNTLQLEAVRKLSAQLAEAQRHERFRISQDLHDTVQQNLAGIQPLLETSIDQMQTDPAKASALLERSMRELDEVSQTLRRIRHNLVPPDTGVALADLLRRQCADWQARAGRPVAFEWPDDLKPSLSVEARYQLSAWLTEVLNNIDRHAQASQVSVQAVRTPAGWQLQVDDNGRGFSDSDVAHAQAGGSFGMRSLAARAAALGASFAAESRPPAGGSSLRLAFSEP